VSALTTHWTGEAVETPSTWPRRLLGEERVTYRRRRGPPLPRERPIGTPAGTFDHLRLYPTAGDKNCELLAQDVVGDHAGISLGSAVTLGMTTLQHGSVAGVIPSCSARPGHIDLETGLLVGMAAWPGLSRWLPMEGTLTEWVDALYFLPHFMGALDQPATPALIGLQPDTDPARVATAWAQGLVAELVRLRPSLEEAAGHPIRQLSISGGPSEDPRWMQLLADAFDCPVLTTGSRFVGCRGAVEAVRSAQGLARLPAQPETRFEPVNAERFRDWHHQWLTWFDRLTS
jgi:sugar (pentulose or hexulose) kinase